MNLESAVVNDIAFKSSEDKNSPINGVLCRLQ
jgi:hypothetical protein